MIKITKNVIKITKNCKITYNLCFRIVFVYFLFIPWIFVKNNPTQSRLDLLTLISSFANYEKNNLK